MITRQQVLVSSHVLYVKLLSSFQCLKRVMAYVKANDLRDPQDKLKVIPDKTMAPVFGSEKIYAITITKFLKVHLTKPVKSST